MRGAADRTQIVRAHLWRWEGQQAASKVLSTEEQNTGMRKGWRVDTRGRFEKEHKKAVA